jgi:hypothetical protein
LPPEFSLLQKFQKFSADFFAKALVALDARWPFHRAALIVPKSIPSSGQVVCSNFVVELAQKIACVIIMAGGRCWW